MKVWVLVDDKTGSSKQSLALAKILRKKHSIKKVQYTFWAKLPNCIPFLNKITITNKTKKNLLNKHPDLIIAAGRRLARVACYLKSVYPKCNFIQILKPHMPLKNFDAIILPHHDIIRLTPSDDRKKIIRVNGAVIWLNGTEVSDHNKIWAPQFKYLPKPKIALLVGGNSRGCKIEAKHALELTDKTVEIAKKLNASLLVTNSRRTDHKISQLIFNEIKKSGIKAHLYDANSALENPYKGYLACADYIIVTGDSISMCIESISMGKPVIVYCPKTMVKKKHWRFISQLIEEKKINLLLNIDLDSLVVPKNRDNEFKIKLLSMLSLRD